MKNLHRIFVGLIISSFIVSCTPQEVLTENTDSTNQDVYGTGGETHGGTDDDRDGNGD